ncbi:hypothetical protein AVEN_128970-1 [Araneus ventricosus]|uniref:Uncharacterized protein n=1 Tax=Araneus ventricosus TaxID=182803 RepID=A0A4Y2QD03_ARAVE|nr:hypothetical protein AVEN_128970-1 [Araneus ventricosus]
MLKTERLKCIFVCLRFPKLERKEEFGEQIIGYGGFQELPPRSPDLTPMDFFLWGYLKQNGRSKKEQDFVFRRQLEIARRRKLRVVIHCREVDDDAIKIMHEPRGRGGLVVKSRPRDQRVAGSKPDSTEDPPCMGPVAR